MEVKDVFSPPQHFPKCVSQNISPSGGVVLKAWWPLESSAAGETGRSQAPHRGAADAGSEGWGGGQSLHF